MVTDELRREIASLLAPLNPDKVILFGSFAWGTPCEDSDLDLYVVTEDDLMPQTFKDRSRLHIRYSRVLDRLYERHPVDLIIHTRPMHKLFIDSGSAFSKKIMEQGYRIV